ncbi:family finger-like domain protein [Ruegeria sp. THAF57]|uniref:zinc-ribbon domain-containing protein n=1 Tax=Ruegeria sp. THAF57 TaxID=2744555 RepID=UPI0015DFED8D|nr:zinc-ribbon domain-containing protein [Ruegeria sp. THAF57]CAD0184091.1 family finger-like domain protein [Ruegeria sp. THAF57]
MRLTCPNCGAQYEVPDEVIPAEGRDVQCSNCEKTWFQSKDPEPAATPEPAEPETDAAEKTPAEPVPEPPQEPAGDPEPETQKAEAKPSEESTSGNVDPAVANILKEEAAREADLRAKEAETLETQPDLALDAPPEPEPEQAIKELTARETAEDAGQKDALPDVEAINSSLRSEEPAPKKKKKKREEVELLPRKSGGGFRRGFLLMIIIGVILFLIYGNAQRISEAVPQADPVLDGYVTLVDQARVWLEAQTGAGTPQN